MFLCFSEEIREESPRLEPYSSEGKKELEMREPFASQPQIPEVFPLSDASNQNIPEFDIVQCKLSNPLPLIMNSCAR